MSELENTSNKFIGLKPIVEELTNVINSQFSSTLKQQSLLFDQIGVLRLNTLFVLEKREDVSEPIKQNLLELQWLIENNIVFEPVISEKILSNLPSLLREDYISDYQRADNIISKPRNQIQNTEHPHEDVINYLTAITVQDTIMMRLISALEWESKVFSIISTSPLANIYRKEILDTKKIDIAQVIINNLPLPDSTTPWEKILDFRNDPSNKKNLLGLRRWIRKISTEEISKPEIEEEIKWLINEFQNHMKLHKMKANTETLEIIVKTPLEIIENLVKLKLSKLPEPFFAVKKRQINLLEAELNAPGREMAYIIKSRDTFQSDE